MEIRRRSVCWQLRLPRSWMQNVAAEMNLAETASSSSKGDAFGLRWFTPTVEVDFCGHATLAAAHALWERVGSTAARLPGSTRRAAGLTAKLVDDRGNSIRARLSVHAREIVRAAQGNA